MSSPPPLQECKPLYLEYAKLEETYGLARHAMDIYARALAAVPKAERKSVLDLYVSRASDFFGIAKVRRHDLPLQRQQHRWCCPT